MMMFDSIIRNVLSKIGPSNKTLQKIQPWIIYGFVFLVVISLFIYFIGEKYFLANSKGFWELKTQIKNTEMDDDQDYSVIQNEKEEESEEKENSFIPTSNDSTLERLI